MIEDAEKALQSRNILKAVDLLQPSADAGNAVAQRMLGTIYLTGVGVRQDLVIGAHWLEKSASSGDKEAQNQLGRLFASGKIGADNNEQALA